MMGTNKQEPQHYQLKWNNHHANLSCVFEQLLQAEAFTDVTIACDGTSLKCHKMVLAACSSYFQKLFTDNPCQHPIVVLKDVRFSVFHSLLDFMYKGEVNVSEADLPSLMKLADSLKIKGLVEESSPHPPPPLSPIQSLTKVGDGTKNSSTWTSDDLLNNRASLVPSSNPASKSVPPIACLNSSSPPLGPKFNVITANGGDERSPSRESGSSSAGSVSDVRMAAKSGFLGALSIQHPILRNALGTGNGITGVSDSSSAYDSSDNVDRNSVLLERTERIAADVDIVKKEMSTSMDQQSFVSHAVAQLKKEASIPSLNPIRLAQMPLTVSHVPKNKGAPVTVLKSGPGSIKAKGINPSGIKFENLLDAAVGNFPSIPPLITSLATSFTSPLNLTSAVRQGSEGRGEDSSREWKRYKLYDREDLHAAIEEVKQGKSAAAAAKKFGIPSRTLYAKIKKLGIPTAPRKAYGRMVLNAQQYQRVSGAAGAAAAAGGGDGGVGTGQQTPQQQLAAATSFMQILSPLTSGAASVNRDEDSFYEDLRRAYLNEDEEEDSMDDSAANSRTPDLSSKHDDDGEEDMKVEGMDEDEEEGSRVDEDEEEASTNVACVVEAELGTGDDEEEDDVGTREEEVEASVA